MTNQKQNRLCIEDRIEQATTGGLPIIMDGALGTLLDDEGADTSTPVWSGFAPLDCPDLLLKIHKDYIAAGAEIITTATFRTTMRAFDQVKKEGQNNWEQAAIRAVELAREAANNGAYVAGSIAPLCDCFRPELAPLGPGAAAEHRQLASTLARAGVDFLLLETFGTVGELEQACSAAAETNLPFMASVTTLNNGCLLSGESIEKAIDVAHNALAFGINCVPPSHVDIAIENLLAVTNKPLAVYANLGHADPNQDWNGSAFMSPNEYAALAANWVNKGVQIAGACCGSNPNHIAALSGQLKQQLR